MAGLTVEAAGGVELGRESRKTTHRILAAFDAERHGLEALHRDLFDSDDEIVLSALDALGTVRDPRSLKVVARLLTQQDESTQCAAVETLGRIGHPTAVRSLLNLFRVSGSDRLRAAVLSALVSLAPRDGEVDALVRESVGSPASSADLRATAVTLLLKLDGSVDVRLLLDGARDRVVESLYAAARENGRAAGPVLQHGLANYHRLSVPNRQLLLDAAAANPSSDAAKVLLEALKDVDPGIRRSAYGVLGNGEEQAACLAPVVTSLGEGVDALPSLEEDAVAAIGRLEQCLAGRGGVGAAEAERIQGRIAELFDRVSAPDRRMGSDSHELGWLIARSREYVEYYADEDFRQGILQYLKGSSYYTRDRLLRDLKATAVRVEVRHFEGYQALVDILKNPKRPGIALVGRELAIARLGKQAPFHQLVRNLHLTRLIPGVRKEDVQQYARIYTWAREARLFRLAEAALNALALRDRELGLAACRECLAPPIVSKILTIAAIRLLKSLDWAAMEPSVLKLLNVGTDPHVLLNLIDALCGMEVRAGAEVVRAMLQVLRFGTDREITQRAADFLGAQSAPGVLESAIGGFEDAVEWKQQLILSLVARQVNGGTVSNREGLIEFLYRRLREEGSRHQARAVVLLWRLGDDYAAKVLKEFVQVQGAEEKIEILQGLCGALTEEVVPALLPLVRQENAGLQEALRVTLLSAEGAAVRRRVRDLVLAARGQAEAEEESVQPDSDPQMQVDFQSEKRSYRFEREYVQDLAVMFTDIQGYTKKAQALSTMQLTALIQEYEGILLPTVASHGGELIKKMGDGHLFVFGSPLNSALAAVRIQKALRRFNAYRGEAQRLVIRAGVHWGKVVRKEGDVLGNNVNIAARLESSASGGSILISEALHQQLGGHIHSREIGLISVKGISEPIRVFEPSEISIEFPAELDPLKNPDAAGPAGPGEPAGSDRPEGADEPAGSAGDAAAGAPAGGAGQERAAAVPGVVLDTQAVDYLVDTFAKLNALCLRVERGEAGAGEIRRELVTRWTALKAALKRGRRR